MHVPGKWWRSSVLTACFGPRVLLAQLPVAAPATAPADVARALAEVTASEEARIRGDSAAWQLLAPGFVFVHSTGPLDDRAAYLAFRAGRVAAGATAPKLVDAERPEVRLNGDVLIRVRLAGDGDLVSPGRRAHLSRLLDVYVRRAGVWQWLAHQTSEVAPRWVPVQIDTAVLADLAGTYAAADGAQRRFVRRGGALVQLTGGAERSLVSLSDATFGYPGFVATVTFVRDRTGRVVAAEQSAQVGFTRFQRVSP